MRFDPAVVVIPAHDEFDELPSRITGRARTRSRADGHERDANTGFRADLLAETLDFATSTCDDDVDLVWRFEESGRRIHRNAGLSVITSARSVGHAPRGFAAHLRFVARRGDAA